MPSAVDHSPLMSVTSEREAPLTTTKADLQLIPLEQAAGLLSVSLRTVDRMVRRGELRVVRIGRLRRVRQQDVEALAAGIPSEPVLTRERTRSSGR